MSRIESSYIRDVDGMGVGVVLFNEPMEVLSCAILNGGSRMSRAFFVMQVPRDYDSDDPVSDAARIRDLLALPEDSVGMMTAAEVSHVFSHSGSEFNGMAVEAVATAGLSNQVVAGDILDNYPERRAVSDRRSAHLAGTINVAVVSPLPLTVEGKINMLIPLVEAKSAALAEHGYRETGTTSDSMAVFSPVGGDRVSYTGTGSDIGIAAARAVRSAVGRALDARGEHPVMEEPLRILRNLGYDIDRLMAMSGADMPEVDFRRRLEGILSEPEVRAMLDLVVFASDRADSMAEDGCPELKGLLMRMVEDTVGKPETDLRSTEAAVAAIARYVVIGNE